MRKPVFAICEQQRRRSACASAQSDQRLCCLLPRQYNTSRFYTQNFKCLASFSCGAGWFESDLVADPKDRFSREEALIIFLCLGFPTWKSQILLPNCFLSLVYCTVALKHPSARPSIYNSSAMLLLGDIKESSAFIISCKWKLSRYSQAAITL